MQQLLPIPDLPQLWQRKPDLHVLQKYRTAILFAAQRKKHR